MPNEDDALSTEARRDTEGRPRVVRERLDAVGRTPGGTDDPGAAPPPGEREKTGERETAGPGRGPDDGEREAQGVSEPWRRDASGRPEQPQDRPPARPHMTVTHMPEPSPHEVREKMDGD